MRVDGAEAVDAGGNLSSPPAFQIIVLVSALGNSLSWRLAPSVHASVIGSSPVSLCDFEYCANVQV